MGDKDKPEGGSGMSIGEALGSRYGLPDESHNDTTVAQQTTQTPGAQRKLIESGADLGSCAINIQSIDEYLRKVEALEHDLNLDFPMLSKEFYGFKWSRW